MTATQDSHPQPERKRIHKVAVCGVHGSGKTTLCNWLTYQYKREGYNAKMVNEGVRHVPFPINLGCSLESQMWIVSKQIQDELTAQASKYELLVCDRTVYDAIVYGIATNVGGEQFIECEKFARSWCQTYDAIFLVKAHETDIPVHDNFRSTDINFFRDVNRLFISCMADFPNVEVIESHKILGGDYRGIKERFDAAMAEAQEERNKTERGVA